MKQIKDRNVLPAFHDVPAEHWTQVRTANPVERTLAAVRHRTGKAKDCLCLSRKTGRATTLKQMMSAQADWRNIDGADRIPKIVHGIAVKDRIKKLQTAA